MKKFNEWLENYNPKVTIQMNKMGHLHMWLGEVIPKQISKYNYQSNNKDSDVYVQNDSDIESILDQLSKQEKDDLLKGYPIVTNKITDEYFHESTQSDHDVSWNLYQGWVSDNLLPKIDKSIRDYIRYNPEVSKKHVYKALEFAIKYPKAPIF